MKRRSLLSLLAAASGAAAVQPLLAGSGRAAQDAKHVLLLLELRGGNDGLNTVGPHRDPLYRQARPTLALTEAITLLDELTLHPALAPLLPIWHQERLGFALGVGWPQANRSHFKAADQWATASASGEGMGWLARAITQGPLVAVDSAGCRAMEGGDALALQLSQAQLQGQARATLAPTAAGASPILRQLLAMEQEGEQELLRLRRELAPLPPGLAIPRNGLGQQVALALRLIGSGSCPPVIQLAQGGYDTHANQTLRQNRQLGQLAGALAFLDAGLSRLPRRPRVTLLSVSEFGRRLQENGSGGTDHGSASVAMLYGDHIPERLLGHYPRLDQVDARGDLIPNLSPADLYRHVLKIVQA